MMARGRLASCTLALGVLAVAATAYAAPPSSNGAATAGPCNMADFVGGAAYPAGMGPTTMIGYPATAEQVTGKVWVQQGSYAGIWSGDSFPGDITKVQLFVDGSLVATMDLTSKRVRPLVWDSTHAAKGAHQMMIRTYNVSDTGTRSCYLDSENTFPVVI